MAIKYDTVTVTDYFNDCKNEQSFKMKWINANRMFWKHIFSIETEETVKGFPDVMLIDYDNRIHLLEFKITDRYGRFKFQKTQPAFYMKYADIPVSVVVLDRKIGNKPSWVHFKSQFLFEGKLIAPNATVSLENVKGFIKYANLYEENEQWEVK